MSDNSPAGALAELLERARVAAARYDGAALEAISVDLERWSSDMQQTFQSSSNGGSDLQPERAALLDLRPQLENYRDLCGFLSQSLQSALQQAVEENDGTKNQSRYGKSGSIDSNQGAPVLKKAYG